MEQVGHKTKRRRVRHELSFKERLRKAAREAREAADALPAGKTRDQLLQKARQTETAAEIDKWVSSPGLKPPEAITTITQKARHRSE